MANKTFNAQQVTLLQTAVRAAGLRDGGDEGRYRLLLGQYRGPGGKPVTSCKQLHASQLEDILAICEAMGWRYPGKSASWYRDRVASRGLLASFAQQAAINRLKDEMGWDGFDLTGMIKRMTGERVKFVNQLKPAEAYKMIEAMKEMFGRKVGKKYNKLKDVQRDTEVASGEKETRKIG